MIKRLIKTILPEKVRLNIRYFLYKINSVRYSGANVYCICCNKSFNKFLSHGNVERKNARCPYCLSLERTRLLMYFLQNEMQVFKKKQSILHFAPEKAVEARIKQSSQAEYLTADINPALADNVIDIQNIPFDSKRFDLVICSHVLGHVPNEQEAVNEIYRVLKPGGTTLILTLIDSERTTTYENKTLFTEQDRLNHYGEPDLLRLHGKDFISRLQKTGIKVERVDYRKYFTEEEKRRFQLGDGNREIIYVCTRIKECKSDE